MAKSMVGRCLGVTGLAAGIAAGMAAPLAAQTLWLPGSDPVNIGRSGTGVAFGQSLEAAALNPALLSSLRDKSSAYLAMGVEMQSAQLTSSSEEKIFFSSDRNRALPALGAAWRFNDSVMLGVKMDSPFMRHGEISDESTSRFCGSALSLTTRRVEFQGSLALNSNWSVGVGLGMARLDYSSTAFLRAALPTDPAQAVSGTNPSLGLMEFAVKESGQANVATYSLGFRWAISPRWTVAGAYQSGIKATPGLSAELGGHAPTYYDNRGYDRPLDGTAAKGPGLLSATTFHAGTGSIVLPSRTVVGVRQRLNQIMTWEADIHYIKGAGFELPTQAYVVTPSGSIMSPGLSSKGRDGFGLSAMMELTLSKRWTARVGMESMPALTEDISAEPLVGGAPAAAFSAGGSYKVFGGEISMGYQYRQSKDRLSSVVDGAWDLASGYHKTGTAVRVEGAGHLLSIGFKKVF